MRPGRPRGAAGWGRTSSRQSAAAATSLWLALVLLAAGAAVLVENVRREAFPQVVPRLVPTDIRFFADPRGSSAAWVQDNAHDRRAALIGRRIASRPQGVWFTAGDPDSVEEEVRRTSAEAAARRELPVLVMYAIPHRDCWSRSAGGAASVADYRQWVDGFSRGLGAQPAWVVLEPDSLMQSGCLTARQRSARFEAVAYAARTLDGHNGSARVYLDAGSSTWHSVAETAALLRRAGVSRYADGIALNVANFNPTSDEVRFGTEVIRALGDPGLRMVVDTGRNGDGAHAHGATCDPPSWSLGTAPTSRTGNSWVDGFLWVKPPGQSDGCRASAGTFLPDEAYRRAAASP